MLKALAADAIFIAAVLIEVLAVLSMLQAGHAIALREEFEPVLAFYRTEAVPVLAYGANLAWPSAPGWFSDAAIVAAIVFFLFFIAQARNAMAPYSEVYAPGRGPTRVEAAIDWVLPAGICAIGALILAPTLLPFLTLPAALILGVRKLASLPSWFEVSLSYYVNVLCLGVALAVILFLQR